MIRIPSVEGHLRRVWLDPSGTRGFLVATLLLPATLLFTGAVRFRNWTFDRGWRKSRRGSIPVVSVGNLTVGGTGKTPVTAWLARVAAELGGRPAIISRGYGEDELALHRRWNPEVPVFVAPDRIRGIEAAAESGSTLALLDDGFQHRGAARDLDLALLATEQPFPARLLPRGPYREPLSSLGRADLILLTRKSASATEVDRLEAAIRRRHPGATIVRIHLSPSGWRTLSGEKADPPTGAVLAVSSVADPETFLATVKSAVGDAVEGLAFRDHHVFTPDDVRRIVEKAEGRGIVTTEKDAVKLVELVEIAESAENLSRLRVLRLEVVVERGEEKLRGALRRLIFQEDPGRPVPGDAGARA